MFLIPTVQAQHLADKLQSRKISVITPALNKDGLRYFPDGELYVKIPNAKRLTKKHVVVLHSGAPHPNEGLIELELILQAVKEVKASPIDVFFAYFPYGMQDKAFAKGETNVAENLVEKFLTYYRVRKIYIIDAHFTGKEWAAKYPLSHVSAVPYLQKAAFKDLGKDVLFLSPDKGGARRTHIKGVQKKRQSSYDVTIQNSATMQKTMQNRCVAVVDDLIETGGTLERFYEECQAAGAKDIVALITHGVLQEGISRIKKKYRKIYLTNTILRKEANVDVASLIAKAIS